MLATASPEIILADPGEWETFDATLIALLTDSDKILRTFLRWMTAAREALLSGTRRTEPKPASAPGCSATDRAGQPSESLHSYPS